MSAPNKYVVVQEQKLNQIKRAMEIDPEYYSAWDKDFIKSVERYTGRFSEKQEKAFERLWEKTLKR